jgi:hypothetical protein
MEGHIELIEEKPKDLKRMKIDGVFYSYFGKTPLKVGDSVRFEFAEQGKYLTIVDIQVVAPNLTFKDRSIIKQTALKCACMTYRMDEKSSVQEQLQTILKIADTFEKHLVK